jgi:hypothetical protein
VFILPGALAPLARFAQFILVQFVPELDEQGRPTGKNIKHPINPATLLRHDAHDPSIWRDVSTIAAIAAALGPGWGVGFVLTDADPFGCFDIDKCRTADGWTPHALAMLAELPGATEVSNSSTGLHQWVCYQGVAPPHRKRAPKVNGVDHHMEFYTGKRFIAFGSTANGQMYDVTALLPGFIAKWFPPAPEGELELDEYSTPDPAYTPLTDDELFTKARASVPKQDAAAVFGGAPPMASFSDLFDRNVAVLARVFPPQMAGKEFNYSDADAALAKELAYWTGRDAPRVARLMLLSALRREKWDTRVHRTYFQDTIINGIGRCKAVYHVKPVLPAPPPPVAEGGVTKPQAQVIAHNTFVGRDNIAKVFEGCVYVRDNNETLLPNGDLVDQARFKVEYAGYAFSMDNLNEKTTRDAWDAFINNQIIRFPRVEGTMFDPKYEFQAVLERGGRRWVNVYKAPVIDRRPGDVAPFMNLLHKLLPNGDDAIILLSYMAAVVQNPGMKFRWAPFIQGVEGNGKSTIIGCLKHALGNKYIFSVKAGMIENGFNAWLEHNILYVADDIYSSKDRTDMMEALKSLITERDQAITLKGIDSIQKRICGNFIFTDNHKDAMQKRDATRRICTLYCAQQSKYDRSRDGLTKEFFVGRNGLIPWLEREGYAAVAEMLHTMPIDPRYNPAGECQEAPDTSVTHEAIVDGRTGVEHEVAEWIELSEPGFCGNFVSANMLKRKLKENPQFAKFASHLKLKETMLRLGYEVHRGLEQGRCVTDVQPDGMRPVLYVKAESAEAQLKDGALIGQRYQVAQQAAMTAAIERRFGNGT